MTPEEQRLENQKKNAELVHAYKRFAMTDDGEIIMADLEGFCGFKRPSFDNEWNVNRTFCHEGMRNVYLHIIDKVNRKENKDERKPNSTVGGIGN